MPEDRLMIKTYLSADEVEEILRKYLVKKWGFEPSQFMWDWKEYGLEGVTIGKMLEPKEREEE